MGSASTEIILGWRSVDAEINCSKSLKQFLSLSLIQNFSRNISGKSKKIITINTSQKNEVSAEINFSISQGKKLDSLSAKQISAEITFGKEMFLRVVQHRIK